MTKIITKEEFILKQNFFLKEIRNGKIFVLPTDTVYGICSISTNKKSIDKIYNIKERDMKKPFSIIVPDRLWIFKNCKYKIKHIKYLFKIPKEKLTLVLKLKNDKNAFIGTINKIGDRTIGVRIIDHYVQKFLKKLNVPIVATSLNMSGKVPISNISKIDEDVLRRIDYVLDDGILSTKSSQVIKLTS